MLSRTERLAIAQRAATVVRETGALDRVRNEGYTRIDPFHIATAMNVPVMKRPLEGLLGAFLREEEPGILLNIARPAGQVHMTCAHELGHFVLGHGTSVDVELQHDEKAPKFEREADWFAQRLLMPNSMVHDVIRRMGWRSEDLSRPDVLYQLSLRLGTSFTATFWSLRGMNLLDGLSDAQQQTLVKTPLQALKRSYFAGSAEQTLSDVWLLDHRDRGRIIEPRPGDRLVIDLPDHASAGYLWSLDELAAEGFVLRPLAAVDEPPQKATLEDVVVGGVSPRRFALDGEPPEAERIGRRLTLRLVERRPWKPAEHTQGVELLTEFESLQPGLDERARDELLREVASE